MLLKSSVRSFIRSTLLVSLSNGILKASNAVLFVLVVHALGKDAAGRYSTATTLVTLALGLAQFGLDEVLIRESARRSDPGPLFANFLLARLGLTALFIVLLDVGLFAAGPYPPEQISVVLLLSFSALGDAVLLLCQALFIARERPALVLVTSTATSLSRIVLSFAAVWIWPGSLSHLILVFVVTSLAGGLLAFWLSLRSVLVLTVRGLIATMRGRDALARIAGSSTFFWINLFVLAEFQADIVLLSILKTPADVALYNAALTVILAAWILPAAFRTVTYPRLAQVLARSSRDFWRFLRHSSLLAVGLGLAAAGMVALLAAWIVHLLYPGEYEPSVAILRLLTVPLFFAFVSAPGSRALLALNRERLAMGLVAVTATVNLGANLYLIPQLGPLGAAIARAASAGIFCLLVYGSLLLIRPKEGATAPE